MKQSLQDKVCVTGFVGKRPGEGLADNRQGRGRERDPALACRLNSHVRSTALIMPLIVGLSVQFARVQDLGVCNPGP